MNYDNKTLFEFINSFSFELDRKKLPEKYHLKYIKLYFKLNGTKGHINHNDIAFLWGITNHDRSSYYINIFVKHRVLNKSQQTNISKNNNRGYLFLTPLVHPVPN